MRRKDMSCRCSESNLAVDFNRNNSGGKGSHLESGFANARLLSELSVPRTRIRIHVTFQTKKRPPWFTKEAF